jgi:hypothetical protein
MSADEARAEMATVLAINPNISEPLLDREFMVITRDRELAKVFLAGLRKVGVFPPLQEGGNG